MRREAVPAALLALLVGMVIAGVAGGVNWLIAVGSAGTALGTLGLAAFTFTLAARTTELADSSQRLETAANQELTAGRQQAAAAEATALEAQKSRVDAIAPVLDVKIEFVEARARGRGDAPGAQSQFVLAMHPPQHGDLSTFSLSVVLELRFENFGRTPAFARVQHSGATFVGQADVIRIDPGPDNFRTSEATVDYYPSDHPFDAREIRYEIEVRGAMTGDAVDTIEWIGALTPLLRDTGGWRLHYHPLRVVRYEVTRRYRSEQMAALP